MLSTTSTATGSEIPVIRGEAIPVYVSISGTGAVSASYEIQFSGDGTNWSAAVKNGISGTTSASERFLVTAAAMRMRAVCTAISGTGATLSITGANAVSDLVYQPPLADGTSVFINGAGNLTTASGNLIGIGYEALKSVTTGGACTAVGHQALVANTTGTDHTAIGNKAMYSNVGGVGCTAVGTEAQYNNLNGGGNTSIGDISLYSCTTGANNSAIGYAAGFGITTGNENTALGQGSLYTVGGGTGNVAAGYGAMQDGAGGNYNVAIGHIALKVATSNNNVGAGYRALGQLTSGSENAAVGAYGGYRVTTGNQNTFVGESSGNHPSQKVDAANSTALGRYSYTTADNQVVLGGDAVTSTIMQGASVQIGGRDAAAPGAVTIQIQSVATGTTNTAGAQLTIAGSKGTGTGGGGAIVFQVAPAGSTGSSQNALVDALRIENDKAVNFASNVTVAAGVNYFWLGRAGMASPADGVIKLRNNADNGFSRLQFGGTTASFPSLKRSSEMLEARLADDSAYTAFGAEWLSITDGVTAPAAVSGRARIYVDTSDGDLKVIFGDGTIKTIVTDT